MKKSNWVMTDSGWRHRPLFKVLINGVLRFVQGNKKTKLLLATLANADAAKKGNEPTCYGYSFSWVFVGRAA